MSEPMFYIRYEVAPTPENPAFDEVGGAFANCLVQADSALAAQQAALDNFKDEGWRVVSVEEPARPCSREEFDEDEDWLEYFDAALENGACFVFHQWPAEPQGCEVIH